MCERERKRVWERERERERKKERKKERKRDRKREGMNKRMCILELVPEKFVETRIMRNKMIFL